MSDKITLEHLKRGAIVYVRQSTVTQVIEHKESQRRQYALAKRAEGLGFRTVDIIDDDLGRSGSPQHLTSTPYPSTPYHPRRSKRHYLQNRNRRR